ncbi:hypothetical protein OSB04_027821 [Centaurea solstitialis]|uniref:Integrase catalytic domain-containing protein n=1 Tax=Centaurea solstitialis TaxID=347529 RepID=A0AA38SS12_9ASTR|nr:hypothetical protein OSB04_027821 [Centaurea solstitialis]
MSGSEESVINNTGKSNDDNPKPAASSDNSSLQITLHKLNGKNFLQWSQSVSLFLRGKGRIGYVTSKIPVPATTDPKYSQWDAENSMVMTWLINSMDLHIGKTYMFLPTAADLWKAIHETYSDLENSSQVFEIKTKLRDQRQGSLSVTEYYSVLCTLWQELDLFYPNEWKCTSDVKLYAQRVEKERVFDFLYGLSSQLDDARGRVLSRDPFPTLREAFAEVRREETRRKVMVAPEKIPIMESTVLAASNRAYREQSHALRNSRSSIKNPRPFCEHCKRVGHLKETCWKLHGRPEQPRESKVCHVDSSPSNSLFSVEQIEQLKHPFTASSTSTTPTCTVAEKGPSDMTLNTIQGDEWIVDSGASDHMTGSSHALKKSELLMDLYPCSRKRIRVNFRSDNTSINDLSGKMIGTAMEHDRLYYMKAPKLNHILPCNLASASSIPSDIMLWHNRLGHPSFPYLNKLFPQLFINKDLSSFHCEICQLAKHTRIPFKSRPYTSSKPFSLIHSDLWGPSRVTNMSRTRWFITFIDDHTRMTWVYLMKEKSATTHIFKTFHSMIRTQFNANIKILRSDNGTEYVNEVLGSYLTENGIVHHSSCTNTPQQNGVAERKNRHILEISRSLMFTTNVPKYYWGEAVLTAVYLMNRMPSKVLKFQTPLQVFLNLILIPTCSLQRFRPVYLDVFPSSTSIHIVDQNLIPGLTNGEEMEEACFWECSTIPNPIPIQSAENTPVEIPNHSEATPSVQIPSDENTQVENQVEKPPMIHTYGRRNKPHVLQSDPVLQADQQSEPRGLDQEMQMEPDDASRNDELPIALRKGVRNCTKHPLHKQVSYVRLSPSHKAFITNLQSTKIPRNIDEALKDPLWKQAVLEEMTALRKNDTWSLVKLPNGKETVGCRWLFNIKFNADGSINRYKARLVARGFTQTYGVDYSETFAPVAKLNTVRVLMSLAANENWPLYQLDVKNAFLNGNLEEEVFMDIPSGFQNEKNKGLVCRLKRSLYGLKQSPRAWFEKFGGTMKHLRFIQGQADHTLFYKHSVKGEITILIVYVDDIIITGSDNVEIENVKKALAQAFEIKDLGVLKYFLGMEVARSKKGISITQHKYIIDLLKETGMIGCKPISTLIDSNVKLNAYDGELVEKGRYQRLVGRLIYLSHTRPDIAFAVSQVSQFMHARRQPHMLAVFRILRYLKSTPGKGLFFKSGNTPQVEIYTDSDWGGCPKDGRSTTGYCTFVYGNLVTWKSKKQPMVSRSTAEAELRAVAQGICELIWISRLLKELRMNISLPMRLFCDNNSAISTAHNPVHHERTKHVEIDRHFIKEKIDSGGVCIVYIPTNHQVVDVFTKGLFGNRFECLISKRSKKSLRVAASSKNQQDSARKKAGSKRREEKKQEREKDRNFSKKLQKEAARDCRKKQKNAESSTFIRNREDRKKTDAVEKTVRPRKLRHETKDREERKAATKIGSQS